MIAELPKDRRLVPVYPSFGRGIPIPDGKYEVTASWAITVDGNRLGYLHRGMHGFFATDLSGEWVTCWYIADRSYVRDRAIERLLWGRS